MTMERNTKAHHSGQLEQGRRYGYTGTAVRSLDERDRRTARGEKIALTATEYIHREIRNAPSTESESRESWSRARRGARKITRK